MTGSELNIPEHAVLHILVLDFETLGCEETSASGFSRRGCRVLSTKHRHVGKTLGLRIAGFDQMVKARVSEVNGNDIVVRFEFDEAENTEKRSERRRRVSIPAWVSGQNSREGMRCEIVDASPSGCRLASHKLEALPVDIQLQIAGLDLPVVGKIVWRSPEYAGVKLIWKFTSSKEFEEKRVRPPDLAEKTGAGSAAKRRGDNSGFGVRRSK
ncbi:MAG: hypothetical protein Tsb0019_04310 [Roseibium sp.]